LRDKDSSDFQQQRLATKKVLSLFLKLRQSTNRAGGWEVVEAGLLPWIPT